MTQLVDSFSLEKGVRNVTIPRVAKSIKAVSQVPFEQSIVKYRNISKYSFVTRVTKFQTIVGILVLELLNTMKFFLNRNDLFISPWKVRNCIDTFTINKCQLPNNLASENYINILLIILKLLV